MEDSNKKENKPDLISKVEKSKVIYNIKYENKTEINPVLEQLIEIGLKQIELGQTKPHEQVMAEMKLKYHIK